MKIKPMLLLRIEVSVFHKVLREMFHVKPFLIIKNCGESKLYSI